MRTLETSGSSPSLTSVATCRVQPFHNANDVGCAGVSRQGLPRNAFDKAKGPGRMGVAFPTLVNPQSPRWMHVREAMYTQSGKNRAFWQSDSAPLGSSARGESNRMLAQASDLRVCDGHICRTWTGGGSQESDCQNARFLPLCLGVARRKSCSTRNRPSSRAFSWPRSLSSACCGCAFRS